MSCQHCVNTGGRLAYVVNCLFAVCSYVIGESQQQQICLERNLIYFLQFVCGYVAVDVEQWGTAWIRYRFGVILMLCAFSRFGPWSVSRSRDCATISRLAGAVMSIQFHITYTYTVLQFIRK